MRQVLLATRDLGAARSEIEGLGGRVTQVFTPQVFEATLPDDADASSLASSTAADRGGLDPVGQLAYDAWTAGRRKASGAARRASQGLSWDTPGYTPPRSPDNDRGLAVARDAGDALRSTGTPTSRFLIGSVAVGLVVVSRDRGDEAMSAAEQTKVVQEVQEGLSWLATLEPRANVSFVYDIRQVEVDADPGPYGVDNDAYENYERGWRDAALAQLGHPTGRAGSRAYVNAIRQANGTDWAYVAYFCKYPLHHFAYAGQERLVMAYSNDNWGVDAINAVFAHETCHIFGAADEYGNCSCGSVHGELSAPNNNCRNCFPPGTQEPCVMNANTLEMCTWSRQQIGWDERLFPVPPERSAGQR